YLSKHRDYFLSSFPLITHYYVFMYIVQLIVKFQRFSEASYEKLEPLYFTLDWESLSRRRKAADDLSSYRYVKSKQENLFPHIHTLSHLSHLAADLLLTEDSNINTNKDLQEINLLTYSNIRILIAEGKLDGEKFYQSLK